jgi:hypothetical protein
VAAALAVAWAVAAKTSDLVTGCAHLEVVVNTTLPPVTSADGAQRRSQLMAVNHLVVVAVDTVVEVAVATMTDVAAAAAATMTDEAVEAATMTDVVGMMIDETTVVVATMTVGTTDVVATMIDDVMIDINRCVG